MTTQSAGILMYRNRQGHWEYLLAHSGGPFYAKKDLGVWSIPKGEIEPDEDPFQAARREFAEEMGMEANGNFMRLTPRKVHRGKMLYAWAVEGDLDPAGARSNTFEMEWPPHTGKLQAFPEVDRFEWFPEELAKQKIFPGQVALIEELAARLNASPPLDG